MSDPQNQNENAGKIKFYTIGDVAKMLDVATSVLRYWEKEFPQITPLKTDYGHRIYTKDQIEVIKRIKTLLYEDGMTIKGARNILLKAETKQQEEMSSVQDVKNKINDILSYIRKEKQE
ncbi:MAG: MerR family transcriptional regulator [Spirochaetales bacterium]|nr:MerR family transcriptional regulator [Spirochaetales bacterium]MBR6198946.1 MerR family transcriptional regulator [Spirochaetales bacterium]